MSLIPVRAHWDAEASVWTATSDDVPGLATEAAAFEELNRKLPVMIPELFEANNLAQPHDLLVHVLANYTARVPNPRAA